MCNRVHNSPSNTHLIILLLEAYTHPYFALYHLTLAVAVFTSCVSCCLLLITASYLSTCSVKLLAGGIVAMNNMNNLTKWRIAASISVGLPENHQLFRVL